VRAPFFLIQQLLPVLHDGSSITLVSSMAAHAASEVLPAYAATKGAVDTLVKQLAFALGPRGIRVNAVLPGLTETPSIQAMMAEKYKEEILARTPLGRMAQPEEIAKAVLFLASDDASFITGAGLEVTGGWEM
jgi:3-oxoacyl-[acyl-carrier protein] reductase